MTPTYRLYYNKDGTPRFYSMEDVEGDYIAVDQNTYQAGRYDVRIVDGRIRSLSENTISRYQVVTEESDTTVTVHPEDISIIVDKSQQHILLDYKTAY